MMVELLYLRRSFIMEFKKIIAYPQSFWIIFTIIPMYSLIQVVFLETIFSQTSNFGGYNKYEAYVLIGTYTMIQTMGHMIFFNRLADLKRMIRGGGLESFDMALVKPINTQFYSTLGRFNFGNVAPFSVALYIVIFGYSHSGHQLGLVNSLGYLLFIPLGLTMFYVTCLFVRCLIFWVPDLQVTDDLWQSTQEFGRLPSEVYKGALGILFNLVIPLTLLASIPSEVLFGKKSIMEFLLYTAIVLVLFLLTRLFWNISINKYSSFSS